MDNGTTISPGTVVNATLRGKGPLLVQGRVDGRVVLDGELRVAAKATVQAEVEADTADIKGQFKGAMKARQAVTVDSGAQVEGSIEAPRVEIDPGARMKARLVMPLTLPRGVKVPATATRDPWAS